MSRLAGADLLILPSHTEAFPNVVVEAMVLGKAVIGSRVGAIPEMLEGNCGLVVEPKDAEGLASTIARVTQNQALREMMGRNGSVKATQMYALGVVFSRWLELWQETRREQPGPAQPIPTQ
jgi:glycosyltransferase involved in cell wall biosynthesis